MQEMNEATRVMPTAGSAPPIDRTMVAGQVPTPGPSPNFGGGEAAATQMGATVVCAVCRTTNSGMETYCGECGFLLASTPGQAEAVPAEEENAPSLVENGTGRRFRLKPGTNVVGRENCDILLLDGTVSRRHASVSVENGAVTITDFGSTNGTQVDGNRLNPDQSVVAAPGATIRFGNATLTLAGPGGAEATIMADAPPAEPTLAVQVEAPPEAVTEQTLIGASPAPTPSPLAGEEPEESPAPAPQAILTPPPPMEAGETPVARLKPTNDGGQEMLIRPGTTTIGRRTGNDVVLPTDPYVSGRHAELLNDNTGCYLTDMGSTNGTLVNGQRLEPNQKQLLLDGDEIGLGQGTYLFETLELPEEEPAPAESTEAGEEAAPELPLPEEGSGPPSV